MRISCIAIEDEPPALTKLKDFISRMPCLELLSTFDNAIEALAWLKENKPGLVFLDIQMDQLTGIQLLETVKVDTAIIITSAYDRYALKGYELNVTDYLLKPYSFERFVKAVDKVLEHYSQIAEIKNGGIDSSIFVKTEYRYERIALDNILYIEGMSDYLRIVCTDKKIMTLQSFAKIEASLPPEKFCRIHKSFLVALDKIRSIERGIVIIADKRIPVSSTYREKLFSRIKLR